MCFAAYAAPQLGITHYCADQWGEPHAATDLSKMTVDHVHDESGMVGKRAPSDEQHLITMCAAENIRGPSRAMRWAERDYLAMLYAG